MSIVLNGTTGITTPDVSVTAQSSDIVTSGNIEAVNATLSGGVYVGGTAAANKLDDYEEGTFTTAVAGAVNATAISLLVGNYIKIGGQVTVFAKFGFTVTTANTYTYWYFTLPFAPASINDNAGACIENNVGRQGAVSTYGSSYSAAYVIFPSASEVPSGTTSCYISYTYRA
jgi:hypothetical protein